MQQLDWVVAYIIATGSTSLMYLYEGASVTIKPLPRQCLAKPSLVRVPLFGSEVSSHLCMYLHT